MFSLVLPKKILLPIFMCLFIHYIGRKAILCKKKNKTTLKFYSSNFTHIALRKDVCVLFAILISKSVSRAIFNVHLVYFISKISHTSYSRTEKKLFCEL